MRKRLRSLKGLVMPANNPKRFFFRLLWTSFVCMCIPATLIGALYFRHATRDQRENQMAMYAANLHLIQSHLELRMQTVEIESLGLARDPLIDGSFMTEGYEEHYWEHMKVLNRLAQQCYLDPFVHDVIFYSKEHDLILSNEDGYVRPARYAQMDNVSRAMLTAHKAQWISWPLPDGSQSIAFVRRLPVLKLQSSMGLLATVVHESTLLESVFQQSNNLQQRLFVFSPQQALLLSAPSSDAPGDDMPAGLAVLQAAQTYAQPEGAFRLRVDDVQTQVLYLRSERGFVYLLLLAANQLDGSIRHMGYMIALIIALVLLLGVLLIYTLSRREYEPLRKLMRRGLDGPDGPPADRAQDEFAYIQACWEALDQKVEQMACRIDKTMPTVLDVFFTRLLKGEAYEQLMEIGGSLCGLCAEDSFIVLMAAFHNAGDNARFPESERTLQRYAARSAVNDLIRNADGFTGHALSADERGVTIILQFAAEHAREPIQNAAEAFAHQIREHLERNLSLRVSIGIGRAYPLLRDVRLSCLEAAQALSMQTLNETAGVFGYDQINTETRRNALLFYPLEQEQRLVQALSDGSMAQALRTLEEFHQAVKEAQSLDFLTQSYQILLSSIAHAFAAKGGNLPDFLEGGLFEQLMDLRAPSEIYAWFQSVVFERFQLHMRAQNESGAKRTVLYICQYIRDHVNLDHSLTKYAELLHMNPTHISAIFHQETGMTFTDYVHGCKVEEIKRLMLTTELKISEIAAEMGLSERSMNRIFLKYTGTTPGQYRQGLKQLR